MTTQYTTILKLALPVQGELSGTWGDVVNNNITQMVEQAVAGKAVVNTWSGNSHTLTTADGTTSESRCAILELTDTNTQLSGVGTVVCPALSKLYIVDNNTAKVVTVKTASGSGVAVPVGKTMLVYCDGTNVVEGVTHANSLSLGTSTTTVSSVLDQDDMSSNSATAIATQQSIKAYVDSQVVRFDTLAEVLAVGNTTTTDQKIQFRDAAIYINSSADGQLDIVADGEVQIATALVDINGNLDVSGTTNISGSTTFTKNAIASVAISSVARSSNTVTVTTSAVHGLSVNDLVNLNGVTDISFNGYFTVTAISSTTVFTFSQTAANASSSGGSTTEIVYNLNASGTALNQMNGPLNIAANSAIDGLEITQSGAGKGLHVTGTTDLVGALTQDGGAVFNEASADVDFRIESNGNANMVFVDGGNNRVGVGTNAPDGTLHVHTATAGTVTASSQADDLVVENSGEGGMTIITPDNQSARIRFTSPSTNTDVGGAFIFYRQNINTMQIGTAVSGGVLSLASGAGVEAMRIAANGAVNFAADVTFANGADIITASAGTSNFRAGVDAGNSIQDGGNFNTVVGDQAGTAITTGDSNVIVGMVAGDALTEASDNIAIGQGALTDDTKGSKSVAIGRQALTAQNFTSATATHNTAVGHNAGVAVTTGISNTLIGALAGDALTDTDLNVAVGYQALTADTLGSKSVALGTATLMTQNFGSATDAFNTAVGHSAGTAVTTGIANTLIGALAGDSLTTGSGNTAVGKDSMGAATVTGDNNTTLGQAAGNALTSGSNNMFLGTDSGRSGSPGGSITTGSNNIVLGDENISSAYIKVDWSVGSDARDKTDFTPLDLGLDFVKALAPVTYKWDMRSKYGDKSAEDYDLAEQTPDGTHKEDWLDIGFKAQEVEALEIAAGYNKDNKTNLVSNHTDDGKQMGLQYSKFVPILVKAMQEQNSLIEALTARIATLEG